MRKMLTGAMAAVALSTALLMGSPATAATAAPVKAIATQTTQQAAVQARSQQGGYQYFNWFWSEYNCEKNGARLQVRRTIRNYYCTQNVWFTYSLYVLY